MIKIIEAPLQQNLHALSVYWWQKNYPHRVVEEAGKQVVLADNDSHRQAMLDDYEAFVDGRLQLSLSKRPTPGPFAALAKVVASYPVTLILVALSIIGFFLVQFDIRPIVDLLRIQSIDTSPLSQALNLPARVSPDEYLAHGQYWRLITPIFLHFSWVHIAFNMLWLWELGRRIESQGGAVHFISVVFFIAVSSNLYQAASTPYAFFGGMSGVIYGLLGYCAVFNFIVPQKSMHLPKEVYIIMLISLLVGWLGIFDFLARMANTAHLSGLIWGCFIALPSALLSRFFDGGINNENDSGNDSGDKRS